MTIADASLDTAAEPAATPSGRATVAVGAASNPSCWR